ncbi:MAG: TFIIB-type zinc ribbon-containing protein, partial [Planctomycetota bacterium]
MLVKCVCPNCSHSYLADDQLGELACPRCGLANAADAGAPLADAPPPPPPPMAPPGGPMGPGPGPGTGMDPGVYDDPYMDDTFTDAPMPMFEAKAPPPMYVTGERMFKGFVFGIVATAGLGFVLGGGLAAVGVIVPGVAAVLMGLVAGAAARYGMGGRTTSATMLRTVSTVLL